MPEGNSKLSNMVPAMKENGRRSDRVVREGLTEETFHSSPVG